MIRVCVDDGAAVYEVAVRELPVSAALAGNGATSGILVLSGAAWIGTVPATSAVVLVAGEPDASSAELEPLLDGAASVILERPRVRPDLVDDARDARGDALPVFVVVECAAQPDALRSVVRDAVGWARSLLGPLEVVSASGGAKGLSALLQGPNAVPVLLRATVSRIARPTLRITAIGEVTTEVMIDDLGRRRSVSTLTRNGRHVAAPRYETAERLALRRALAAAAGGGVPDDLADLFADTVLAERILGLRDRPFVPTHKPA